MATNPHRIIQSPKDQDARLYEAAPDLLAALKALLALPYYAVSEERKAARAAIAKAEGTEK